MARGTVPANWYKKAALRDRVDFIFDVLAGKYNGTKAMDWMRFLPQVKAIAFDASVQTLTAEYDFGWDLPDPCVVTDCFVHLTTVDATETLDVGLLSSESSGDADGLLDGIALDTAGILYPTLISTGQLRGALLREDESGAGVLVPKNHYVHGTAVSVTATASAGTDTAAGTIYVAYIAL